jgi:NitT/TauT family transport system ATP-binding protein
MVKSSLQKAKEKILMRAQAEAANTSQNDAQDAKIVLKGLKQVFYIHNPKQKRAEEFVALEDFSLSIKQGQFVSIIGPSGCGKSTLLDIVSGLAKAKSGEIYIDGKRSAGPALDRGFIMQGYALFPWRTARRNIEYGLEIKRVLKKQREAIVTKFINLVGLNGFEDRYPNELSGGMRQRVAIARSLAYDPEVLLMDEPFAAVDVQTREALQDELLHIWEKTQKTILFVTHSIEEAVLLSDRVVVLTKCPGRIKKIIDINLPRPRTAGTMRASADYSAITRYVWEILNDVEQPKKRAGSLADEILPSALL